MKEQIIQLEPHDDVISARDKLGWVRAPRVLLILPDDPTQPILQRKLDLLILQREATRKRSQLAIITRDPIIREHARELGIACFRTVESSRERYWRTKRARISVDRDEQPLALSAELAAAGTRLRPRIKLWSGAASIRLQRYGYTALGLALILALVLFGPGAHVYIAPAANQVAVVAEVVADPQAPQVDTANGVIPARIVGVEVEGSERISTTGAKQIPSEKATGVALFTNQIPGQVTIPAGTIIRTSAAEPVRFITLVDVTLPGQVGATIEAPIEAVEPGFTGNLPANRINQVEGPLANRIGVTNPQPTRGGDASQEQAISEDDLERLRALLLQQLQQRAFAKMQTDPFIALQETEFIPVESLRVALVNAETFDGFPGQVRPDVGLTMRITVQGLAIDERRARQVVYARMAERVGAGYQISPATLDFSEPELAELVDDQHVTFVVRGAGDVRASLDEDAIRGEINAMSVLAAANKLNSGLPLIRPVRIEPWPSFWPFMPILPGRITLILEDR